MSLREIRKQKTRKTISDVATRMFMEKGYDSVTMADVAAASEVSLSTVFNYFPKKETLVFD
ncbi:MAG: TetR/AcrR family transcriptional regulator, partial [Proteobacteria bacterium]